MAGRGGRSGHWSTVTILVALALVGTACTNGGPEEDGSIRDSSGEEPDPADSAEPVADAASSGCGLPAPALAAPAAGSPEEAAGDVPLTLELNGSTRYYRLAIPDGYDPEVPTPVVLNLHGHGSGALALSVYSQMSHRAADRGYIVVTPDAVDGVWELAGSGADDEFLIALLDDLAAQWCVDLDRVHAAGVSLGAWKASITACSHPQRFASIALVAEEVAPPDCAMSVVAFHGTADDVVPYGEGADPGVVVTNPNAGLPGAKVNMAHWARGAGCDEEPTVRELPPDVAHWIYPNCADGRSVEFYSVSGGGHTWPGSPIDAPGTTHTIDATEIALDFFEATAAPGVDANGCPTVVDETEFPSAETMQDWLSEYTSFGLRSPGSDAEREAVDWLARRLGDIDGMRVDFDTFEIDRWQPGADAPSDGPGRDLASSGSLVVQTDAGTEELAVIGAVPFTEPTGAAGVSAPMVHVPAGTDITAANSAGRIVVHEIEHSSLPYAAFGAIGHHVTDDLPREGDYDRPYLRDLDGPLLAAGSAGAAGIVLVWDAPTDQLSGYWDPHTGTRFAVPGVFVGSDSAQQLTRLAARGAEATVTVDAEWDRAPVRNLIATLPGAGRERIVLNANTDSVNWVQENGTVAILALARYLGSLPQRCRPRDVQFALTANHLGFIADGAARYARSLDEDYDDGTVAFVMVLEHLGTREILPDQDGRLELTGEPEVFAWSAPNESPALVEASVRAVRNRGLRRTAVLQGVGAPVEGQVPAICSQGGLGTIFHSMLVPTIAGISGPWSLWAPGFGAEAVDPDRMRDQTMAFGDVLLALDGAERAEIGGGYPAARAMRGQPGITMCDT